MSILMTDCKRVWKKNERFCNIGNLQNRNAKSIIKIGAYVIILRKN